MVGYGVKYEPLRQTAVDAQQNEHWKAMNEAICAAFHVPAYLAGAAPPPAYNNIEALQQAYYSQCLQELIEAIELLLDEGLALPPPYGTEFDLDVLLRMDTATMVTTLAASVGAGIDSPNEARYRLNKPPVPGGETPYLQQQVLAAESVGAAPDSASPAEPDAGTENQSRNPTNPMMTTRFSASLMAAVHRKGLEEGVLHA